MITLVSFLFVLSLLVFVHESGHYLAARAVGVKVLEFSLGFPPKAIGKKIGDTEYRLGWVPVGGYVRLLGQDPSDENPDEPGNYASKTKLQRFYILVAGPLMNLFFCWVFLSLMYLNGIDRPAYLSEPAKLAGVVAKSPAQRAGLRTGDLISAVDGLPTNTWSDVRERLGQNGEQAQLQVLRAGGRLSIQIDSSPRGTKGLGFTPFIPPQVGKLSPGQPAEKAGLRPGDLLVSIGSERVLQWGEITKILQKYPSKGVEVEYLREGKLQKTQVRPAWNQALGYYVIGVGQPRVHQRFAVGESLTKGYDRAVFLAKMTLGFVGKLLSGQANKDALGGPIMIASMVGAAAKTSLSDLLALVGFISLQLGIFNLFPFPALDGGHILFLGIEAVLGRPVPPKAREKIQQFGFTALLLLIVYISIQDGLRLLGP